MESLVSPRDIQTIHNDSASPLGPQASLPEVLHRFNELARQTGTLLWEVDAQGLYTYVSPVALDLLGYRPEEIVGRLHFYDLHPPEGRESFKRGSFETFARKESFVDLINPMQARDGSIRWVTTNGMPLIARDGTLRGYSGQDRDITARYQGEMNLRKLSQAVEQSPVSVVITDVEGRIEYVNPKFTQISGYTLEEAIGSNPRVLKAGDMNTSVYEDLWRTIRAGGEWRGELHNRRKDGTLYWEWATISPIFDQRGVITHFVAVKEDITERRRAEEDRARLQAQLLQAQKMEAIGRLAGGVAHDFNNMLAATMLQLNLLQSGPNLSPEVRQAIGELEAEATRAANLTRQLLMFSRKAVLQMRRVDVNDVVDNLIKLLRRVIGENYRIEFGRQAQLPPINADVGMIEQVLLNLAVNARDAMPSGGCVRIATREVFWSELDCTLVSKRRAGRFVSLSVSDTGTGIAAEHLTAIFEPFFTTKEMGRGTGLGLSTVDGIVTQHRGWVEVESALGRGSDFHVYLPAADGVEETASASGSKTDQQRPPSGRETILLVEDERVVRIMTRRNLESLGYRVLEAQDPEEALKLFNHCRGKIDFLLTDMVMPGNMTGAELMRQIRRLKPALPTVIMSGYSDDLTKTGGAMEAGVQFLQKPFGTMALAHAIRRGLDEASHSPARKC